MNELRYYTITTEFELRHSLSRLIKYCACIRLWNLPVLCILSIKTNVQPGLTPTILDGLLSVAAAAAAAAVVAAALVRGHVPLEAEAAAGAIAALAAGVRPFLRVHALVPPQVAQRAAGEGALRALVGLLARVDAHVALQVDQLCRGVGAVRALVGLLPVVRLHVALQVVGVARREAAQMAREVLAAGREGAGGSGGGDGAGLGWLASSLRSETHVTLSGLCRSGAPCRPAAGP